MALNKLCSYTLFLICCLLFLSSPSPLDRELTVSLDSSDPRLWTGVRLPCRELSFSGKSLSWGADSLHLFVFSQAICYTFLVQISLLIAVLLRALSAGQTAASLLRQPCLSDSRRELQKHTRTISAALNCFADEG